MSDTTPNLRLPYIMAAQAQKHVTHNEAIRSLDAFVQLAVVSRAATAPPSSPADGTRHIVAAASTGTWSGHDGQIAAWQDGAWMFYPPLEGWIAWVADEDILVAFDGTHWVATGGGSASLNPTPLVGINTTADPSNRLALSSPAALFTHAGSDHRIKVNKATAADTASQLFQTNWSGRAEIGLAGDDDFHFKVSPDGSSWKDAIVINRSTGGVSLPFTTLASGSPIANPWSGKKWAALGTSITSEGNYTAPLATLLGATLVNLGSPGGHLSVPTNPASAGLEITAAVASIPADADLVTLEGCINDFGRAVPLGMPGDTTTATFYGALHVFAESVLGTNSARALVFLTPYPIANTFAPGGWNTPNANGNTLAQFQQAMRDVAHKFGCPVIDMAECGISGQTAALYLTDGLHPNADGGTRFARFVFEHLLFVHPTSLSGSSGVVSTPAFSPAAGAYGPAQSVTIASATPGAAVFYTTDGSTPATSATAYTGPVAVAASKTIKAIAIKSGYTASAIASAAYAINGQVATPAFSPAGGSYGATQTVTITSATAGATIHYTIDGSAPTVASPTYSGPISVAATTTVTALAIKAGYSDSAVASATYAIAAAFSPANLSPAAWWAASDTSTLFQDAAGTTPVTANGQAVARVADKSGNSRPLVQPTAGLRPLYGTDGTHSWLTFDGVDDVLPITSGYFTLTGGNWAIAYASRKATADANHSVVTGNGSESYIGDRPVDFGHPVLSTTDNSRVNGSAALTLATNDHVVVANVSSNTATLYLDGASVGSGTVANFNCNGFYFNLGQFTYGGRIYECIVIPRALSTAEIASLTTYLKARAGIA